MGLYLLGLLCIYKLKLCITLIILGFCCFLYLLKVQENEEKAWLSILSIYSLALLILFFF